ncbi:class I SAM-dependent methyltransferase [Achromobacter xylosoxidans]|uniref:class I SAM-dependent methyltransferase n=1 Tax=Alcaligenes xylosoxydans xylosoxydans TaxID=85698 RepID=UPI001F051188|nr:class I SAM-dependent methyltransferase [Achromobacter xylosoxidans]MCH1985015.1 class I SAM-dependent methyltransferase [Achromobacter xylosoxidans]MCH4587985.1 class I SAM-dependent methyltransferase [Achromobacter xylosoxidans]
MRKLRKLKYIANRALFRLSPVLAERVGIDFRLDTPSRVFLETRVFAYLNRLAAFQREPQQLLFLGLDKHNWHYPRLLRATFHSLDISPRNAVYGRPGLHRIGDALDMAEHYGADAFDVVVANGLLGFGIDGEAGLRRLLAQCHAVLRSGGVLVLGYNDLPERTPFPVEVSPEFEEFVPAIDGGIASRHMVDDPYRHVYCFCRKSG